METPNDIILSRQTCRNVERATKDEYFQFLPLLKLDLEKELGVTQEDIDTILNEAQQPIELVNVKRESVM